MSKGFIRIEETEFNFLNTHCVDADTNALCTSVTGYKNTG